jgi:molybdopterin converting factor small subunit
MEEGEVEGEWGVSVNGEYKWEDCEVKGGDEVAIIPPISGG